MIYTHGQHHVLLLQATLLQARPRKPHFMIQRSDIQLGILRVEEPSNKHFETFIFMDRLESLFWL